MPLFLACALLALVITKMWFTYRVDHEYSKAGKDSPRYKVKLAKLKAAGSTDMPKRAGMPGYVKELWWDAWDDAIDHHKKVRDAKKAGDRPKLRHRVKGWFQWAWKPVGEQPAEAVSQPEAQVRPDQAGSDADPQGAPNASPSQPTPNPSGASLDGGLIYRCADCGTLMPGPGHCKTCGAPYLPTGPVPVARPNPGTQPAPAPSQYRPRHGDSGHTPDVNVCPDCRIGMVTADVDGRLTCNNTDCPNPTSNGGTNMPSDAEAAHGEAQNYEQAKASIGRVREILTRMQDHSTVIRDSTATANTAADALDQDREALKPALDQLIADMQSQNVDSETVQLAQDVLDRVAPDDIKTFIDLLDPAENSARSLVHSLDAAVGSADSTERSLDDKYADLAERMAATGVSGSFVESR